MIEREILLRAAREFSAQQRQDRTTCVASYLVGSVARDELPLGEAVDLDIVLVDEDPPDKYEECVRITDSVLIECRFSRPDDYDDKRALRQHPLHAQSLFDAFPLHDTGHFFDLMQAAVRGQFDTPQNVYARSRNAHLEARKHFQAVTDFRVDPAPIPLDCDELHDLQAVFEWGVTALLTIVYEPHSCRRHMVRLEQAASRLERPDIVELAADGLGYRGLTETDVAELRAVWLEIYNAAGRFHQGPWDEDQVVHPYKQLYYLRGFEALAAEGYAWHSLALMEHTLATCASQILTHAPPEEAAPYLEQYTAWLVRTRKGSEQAFAERVTQAGEFLEEVDTVLVDWARNEGLLL